MDRPISGITTTRESFDPADTPGAAVLREATAAVAGEAPAAASQRLPPDPHAPDLDAKVTRFSPWQRVQHAAVILLFLVLLATGMPQKWPYVEASRWLIELFGGITLTRFVHRMAGLAFSLLALAHGAVVLQGLLSRRVPPSMLFVKRDFHDAVQNLRYYLGQREQPPRFGRFDYRQKWEYWGLLFGSLVMIGSGLVLYFPIAFSRLMPAELIPAAKVMHSNEALLAFLIVIVWHMYGAHLNPEVFPMDTSIFSGKITKRRLKHEHALEYERLCGGLDAEPGEEHEPKE